MLETIKACSFKVKWNLRECYKVTEWKSGAIYRTKSLGMIVCMPDYKLLDSQVMIGSVSTRITKELM